MPIESATVMKPDEAFKHPTMHVIDANKRVVLWTETFSERAWFDVRHRFARGGQTYSVVDSQIGVGYYYVWVNRVGD